MEMLVLEQASTRMVVGVGGYMTDPVVLKKLRTHPNVALRDPRRSRTPAFPCQALIPSLTRSFRMLESDTQAVAMSILLELSISNLRCFLSSSPEQK
jgi:hypothetical protein